MDCSSIDRGLNPLLINSSEVLSCQIANLKKQVNRLPGLSPAYLCEARRGKVRLMLAGLSA